jgi:pantoate--beta-alanine ligase
MGALHEGHAQLIRLARDQCRTSAVSIFVNPLQFDRPDDLKAYPRTIDSDLAICSSLGVDFVFAPNAAEMYPQEPRCTVDIARLADHLCGRFRPGHFAGVATIVLKLFEIVQADRAYFGEKDAQQLAIIRRLVRDFNLPLEIVGVPTVREPDGLALSSRNQRLSAEERRLAPALHEALLEAARQIESGVTDPAAIRAAAAARIPENPVLRLEYLEIVEPEEMQPVQSVTGRVCVAGAMWVGTTRLIDNVSVSVRGVRL